MVISRQHKFIFIHIYKNAGTSIADALLPYGMTNFQRKFNTLLKGWAEPIYRRIKVYPQPFTYHIKAKELVEKLGRETFDSYFTFAFVRNPWDWLLSQYKYIITHREHHLNKKIRKLKDFEEYVYHVAQGDGGCQKEWIYSEDGEQLVDYIGRFENLEMDFNYICTQIGISAKLPHLNISTAGSYKSHYNETMRELVRERFKPDIEIFGYDFE